MSSDSQESDPIESITKGATKAVLEFGWDNIKLLIKKFLSKDLAFIGNQETIDIARSLRKKGEYEFFCRHVEDKDLRILFQMGLTLREYEKKKKNMNDLKSKIKNKYSRKGKYIAYFVQNCLFSKFVGIMLERTETTQQLSTELLDFFNNIEQRAIYVQNDDIPLPVSEEIVVKIQSNSPDIFVVSSIGKSAKNVCKEVKEKTMERISNSYSAEEYSADNRRVYFIIRKPLEI